MKSGIVYLVGAGPGELGLITVRGLELLKRADVVVYDHLASPKLLENCSAGSQLIYAGKEASFHTLDQEQINRTLIEHARAGETVVRLKGGDPFVFGRGSEEASALAEANIPFEVVPGVTAAVGASACAGIPLTHRGLASNFAAITGHETPDKKGSDLDYSVLAKWNGTLAFYMGVANIEHICSNLIAAGMDSSTPAAVISRGATPAQQVLIGTVADIADKAHAADIRPPAIILIGKVVALRDKLKWFERRPLFGQAVVVTRAKAQASDLSQRLEELGAEVIELPTIHIEPPADPAPLGKAVRELDKFDWIIFTSANAVDSFFAAMNEAKLDARALAACRICCVGQATAKQLSHFGLRADAQPENFTGAAVVEHLAKTVKLAGERLLVPRADIAPPELIESLTARGANVRQVEAYRTVSDNVNAEAVRSLLASGRPVWITFTSSSAVTNFLAAIPADELHGDNVRLASIGPSTSATLRAGGLHPTVEAAEHTIEGLISAILGNSKSV